MKAPQSKLTSFYQLLTAAENPLKWLSACFVTIISRSLLLFILMHLNRGYGFTDEGYHLANSLFFENYNVLQKFGFLNKPFLFVGVGAFGLRVCGLACFVITSIYGGWALYRIEKEAMFAILFGSYSLLGFLCSYWWWQPTPNYYSYALILIYIAAILLTNELLPKENKRTSILHWTLIGFFIGILTFVKITSGCALALLVITLLLVTKKDTFKRTGFACIGGIAALLLFNLVSGQGIRGLWIDYREAYNDIQTINSSHGPSFWGKQWIEILTEGVHLLDLPGVWWKSLLALLCLLTALWKRLFLWLFCVVFTWTSASVTLAMFYSGAATKTLFSGVATLIIFLLAGIFIYRWKKFKETGFLWFSLPFIWWFGSNLAFWHISYCSLPLFFGCACLLAFRGSSHDNGIWRLLFIPLSIYLLIATPSFFLGRPYFLNTKLRDQNTPCELGNGLGTILVDEERKRAIIKLQNALGNNPGQIVDLTGASPGWIIAAGGRTAGVPWMFGGHPGSEFYASKALRIAGKEVIEKSIILLTEDHRCKIAPTVLNAVGLSLDKDFRLKDQFTARIKTYFIVEEMKFKVYYPALLKHP